jgi:hypothetical protein
MQALPLPNATRIACVGLIALLTLAAPAQDVPRPQRSTRVVAAPELNPSWLGGIAVLVAGALLILTDPRSKRPRPHQG